MGEKTRNSSYGTATLGFPSACPLSSARNGKNCRTSAVLSPRPVLHCRTGIGNPGGRTARICCFSACFSFPARGGESPGFPGSGHRQPTEFFQIPCPAPTKEDTTDSSQTVPRCPTFCAAHREGDNKFFPNHPDASDLPPPRTEEGTTGSFQTSPLRQTPSAHRKRQPVFGKPPQCGRPSVPTEKKTTSFS